MSLFWELSNSGPTEQIQKLAVFLYKTFDIGLGEQHKLNCLQQRGIRKTSWDGLGKYTEFYLVIGTITSNTSKCGLCCSKTCIGLVHYCRIIVCTLYVMLAAELVSVFTVRVKVLCSRLALVYAENVKEPLGKYTAVSTSSSHIYQY